MSSIILHSIHFSFQSRHNKAFKRSVLICEYKVGLSEGFLLHEHTALSNTSYMGVIYMVCEWVVIVEHKVNHGG